MTLINFFWFSITRYPTTCFVVGLVLGLASGILYTAAAANDIESVGLEGRPDFFRKKMQSKMIMRFCRVVMVLAAIFLFMGLFPSPEEYRKFKQGLPSNSAPESSQPAPETKTANTPGQAIPQTGTNQAHG